jgi:hypothetical protein
MGHVQGDSGQVFWQDDLVRVSKFNFECMDVMLGADSLMIKVRHLISPRWLEKM